MRVIDQAVPEVNQEWWTFVDMQFRAVLPCLSFALAAGGIHRALETSKTSGADVATLARTPVLCNQFALA